MSDCGTNIEYNGILLKNVLSEGWEFQTVFDSTGVDPIGIKTIITCVTTLHTSETNLHGRDVGLGTHGDYLGPGIDALMNTVLIPRRRFRLWIGNDLVFDVWPSEVESCAALSSSAPDENLDIALGPRSNAQVLQVHGETSAKVRFRFEFTRPMRCAGYIGDVLNLRYWISEDVDCQTWMSRRRYTGRIRFKRHTTDITKNPFAIARTLTLPPIQRGFRRESIGWHESPNGLELDFVVMDKEEWAMAPAPATDWAGTYAMTVPPGAVCTEQELSFRLWTHKSSSPQWVGTEKTQLFALAQRIIEKKLHWQKLNVMSPGNKGSIYVLSSVWQEDLKNPEVNVSVRIRNTNPLTWLMNLHQPGSEFTLGKPLPASVQDTGLPPAQVGFSNMYDKGISYHPPGALPPASLAGMFIAALQNPCCPDTLNKNTQAPLAYAQPPVTYQIQTPANMLDDKTSNRYSVSHLGKAGESPGYGMYHWYKMSGDYDGDTGWRAFPKGKQCRTSSLANDNSYRSDTFAFAQIHCGVCLRVVRIHACRTNAWPQIPKPDHWTDRNQIKHVLLDYKVAPCPVSLSADGVDRACEVYATYFYALSRPPRVSDTSDPSYGSNEMLLAGVLPLVDASTLGVGTNTTDFTAMSPEYFKDPKWILDTGVITPGSEMGP